MNRETAILIGAGISGLLNARVLSDTFHRVILMERDALDKSRSGIPQGRHIHTILEHGREIISSLYPQFPEELEAHNIPIYRWNSDVHIVTETGIAEKYDSGLMGLGISRFVLQEIIEKLTDKISNIITHNHTVEGFIIKNNTVIGVKTKSEEIYADLIIDASGRQSQTPQWLEHWGYVSPSVSRVDPYMAYATRWYLIPEELNLSIPSIIIQPRYSSELYRGAAALCVENRKVVVTLLGTNKDYPPTEATAYHKFAQSLPDPMIADWIQRLEPISPIYGFRANNQLRHYEKIDLPTNLLITGDAYCTLNPFYGQGMTIAAMEANLLRNLLQENIDQKEYFSRKFHNQQAKLVQLPWLMATIEDLRNPVVDGASKQFYHEFLHKYLDTLILTMKNDAYTGTAFLKVMHFLSHPITLLHPRILWAMLKSSIIRKFKGVD